MKILTLFVTSLCLSLGALAQGSNGLDFFLKAEELKKSNNPKGAIDEYNKAIAADPANPEFVFRKGNTYILLKDQDNAIQCFQKTVELRKDHLGALTRLAKLYALKNKVNEAIAAYDNAFKFEADPKDKAEYKINIIKLLYKEKRFKEAGPHIADALSVDPNNLNALYYNAKLSNETGKHEEAVKSMTKATASLTSNEPKDAVRYYFELGKGLYHLGKYSEANAAFVKANFGPYKPRIFEMTPVYYQSLATAYAKVYELDQAKEMAEQALKIKPDYSAVHEILVKITAQQNNKSAIVKQLKTAAESEKDVVKKGNLLAQITQAEFESGLYAEAIASATACLGIQPSNYNIGFLKALALARTNKVNDGIAALNELLKFQGMDQETKAMLNFALGLLYNQASNTKMANSAFKKAEFGNFKHVAVVELRKNNDEEAMKQDDAEDTTLTEKPVEN
jgi:tetratricopeptide (TPR) repeat protein